MPKHSVTNSNISVTTVAGKNQGKQIHRGQTPTLGAVPACLGLSSPAEPSLSPLPLPSSLHLVPAPASCLRELRIRPYDLFRSYLCHRLRKLDGLLLPAGPAPRGDAARGSRPWVPTARLSSSPPGLAPASSALSVKGTSSLTSVGSLGGDWPALPIHIAGSGCPGGPWPVWPCPLPGPSRVPAPSAQPLPSSVTVTPGDVPESGICQLFCCSWELPVWPCPCPFPWSPERGIFNLPSFPVL